MEPRSRTVAEHVAAVLGLVAPLPAAVMRLSELVDARTASSDIVLADDVRALAPVPAFDHSAMDGYAVRSADLPASGESVTLRVTADIAAAPNDPEPLRPGTAARIMTGAPLPPGADAVVPVERTSTGRFDPAADTRAAAVTLTRQPRDHIRRRGEDIAAGSLLARAGTELRAPVVAGLAAAGVHEVGVRRRPRVAVIATGSELVPLGAPTAPGQITDSNSLMLAAAIRAMGADVVRLGPVGDTSEALTAALDEAVRHVGRSGDPGAASPSTAEAPGPENPAPDLIVTAGGVSAGAADVVRGLLTSRPEALTDVELAAVGMRPGRPQALARWRGVPWIAVPGTPVAAYVSCAMFVRPAVGRLRGLPGPGARTEDRPVAVGWSSPRGREQVVPVRVTARGIAPSGDGHHLSALVAADALAVVPADVEKVSPGDLIPVIPL
ncbi:molybdopterin molybdotransferase MoeA [Myceligenerans crystallogenes]|uniref:molybdopterin molybdotransferase MoeA n=1 Tax=Myceligenerans crystallogenes TaxID=316335 RepID=UPI0031D4AD02